jgi:hypothetical protein
MDAQRCAVGVPEQYTYGSELSGPSYPRKVPGVFRLALMVAR